MDKANHFKISGKELQSKTIDFLRFPLIIGVIFIHTDFSNIILPGVKQINFVNYPIFSHVFILFSKIIFATCVPLFFLISGFLFFYKTDVITIKVYLQKLKNRVHTLLIPYIFWNLLVILFLVLAQTFLSGGLVSGNNKLIIDYSVQDWFRAFWDTSMINPTLDKSLPINSPFWFIRDLIVVILLSPLICFAIKKIGVYVVIALGLLWIFNPWFYEPGLSTVSFFFFSAGAYFSMYQKNFATSMKQMLPLVAPLYILIVIATLYFFGQSWWSYLYCGGIMVGLILAVGLSAYFIEKGSWHTNTFLANSSFFIFAYHRLPLVFVIKFLFKLLHPQSEAVLLLLYLACPTIIIVLGLLGYRLLRQYLPKFTAVINGGR